LIPDAQYEITSFDTESPVIHKGNELMEEGLKITIGDKPGAAIIKYQAIDIAN
jgi:hypothetical protein